MALLTESGNQSPENKSITYKGLKAALELKGEVPSLEAAVTRRYLTSTGAPVALPEELLEGSGGNVKG